MDYKLDMDEARKADSTGNQIKEIGKYIGTFTQAVSVVTESKGTHGVIFSFQTKDGKKANLPIYTAKADGEKIMGNQLLMAIMACLKLRDLKTSEGTAKKYDYDLKKEVQYTAKIYPELAGKEIGLLLETEEYEKQNKNGVKTGEVGTKVVLAGVFQASTELTSTEISKNQTEPKQLEKMVAMLRHRPLKPSNNQAQASQSNNKPETWDDGFEIPF